MNVAATSSATDKRHERTRLAWLAMLGVLGLSVFCAMWVSEWPHAVHGQRQASQVAAAAVQKRAAIAVRDHVNAFQKWGTQLFVQPTLQRGYHKVAYFTQFTRTDIKADFIKTMRAMLQQYDAVDLFLYIHSNWRYIRWIMRGIPLKLRKKMRLVYNTGCSDLRQARLWIGAGAKVYIGHPGRLSISPVFAVYFARRWLVGVSVKDAVAQANVATRPRLLLAGALSFGALDGPKLWKGTKASFAGDGELTIGSTP